MRYSYMHILAFYLLLLWQTCDGKDTAPSRLRRCTAENHKYFDLNSRRCKRCPKCAKGLGLIQNDADIMIRPMTKLPLTCYKCYPCTDGYYNELKDFRSCKQCRNCSVLGRVDSRVCDTKHNTQCGTCKPGFHDIYKKDTNVEDTKKPCQECQHAVGIVADCQTDNLLTTERPAEGAINLVKPTDPPTSLASPLNPWWPRTKSPREPDLELNNGVQPSTVNNQDSNPSDSNKKKESYKDDIVKQLTVGGVGLIVVSTLIVTVAFGYMGYFPTFHNQNNQPSTGASQNRDSTVSADTNEQRDSYSIGLATDVEPDGESDGTSTPLLSGQGHSVHYSNKTSSCSIKPDACIHFPDKKLSGDQKTFLRCIGSDWPALGRALELPDCLIDCVREDYRGNQYEQIYQMILQVDRTIHGGATVGNVYTALQTLNKHELAGKFLEQISTD